MLSSGSRPFIRNPASEYRVVPLHLYECSTQFPYGGHICGTHLKTLFANRRDDLSIAGALSTYTGFDSFSFEEQRRDELEKTNEVLLSLNESPLKSQTIVSLEEQAPSAIRRLTAKLRQAVSVAGNLSLKETTLSVIAVRFVASNFAETMAPGQGEKLLNLAKLDDISRRRFSVNAKAVDSTIDVVHLEYLIRMYKAYEEKNLPFNEQVRVLTLIPDSWQITSQMIEEKFNCSKHAVKTARRLKKVTEIPMHIDEKLYGMKYWLISVAFEIKLFAIQTGDTTTPRPTEDRVFHRLDCRNQIADINPMGGFETKAR